MMVEKIGRTGELERSIVVRYFASLTSKVSDKGAQQLIVAMQNVRDLRGSRTYGYL